MNLYPCNPLDNVLQYLVVVSQKDTIIRPLVSQSRYFLNRPFTALRTLFLFESFWLPKIVRSSPQISRLSITSSSFLCLAGFWTFPILRFSWLTVSIFICINLWQCGWRLAANVIVTLRETFAPPYALLPWVYIKRLESSWFRGRRFGPWRSQARLISSIQELLLEPLGQVMFFINLIHVTPYLRFLWRNRRVVTNEL